MVSAQKHIIVPLCSNWYNQSCWLQIRQTRGSASSHHVYPAVEPLGTRMLKICTSPWTPCKKFIEGKFLGSLCMHKNHFWLRKSLNSELMETERNLKIYFRNFFRNIRKLFQKHLCLPSSQSLCFVALLTEIGKYLSFWLHKVFFLV